MFEIFRRSAVLEWRHFSRSGWDKAVLIWLPLLAILSLWWIFAYGQVNHLPVAVTDQDRSPLSRQLIRMLNAAPGVQISRVVPDELSAYQAIRNAEVYAAIIIGQDFSRRIYQGTPAPVRVIVNAQFGTHSGIIQRDLRRAVATFSAGISLQKLIATGVSPEQGRAIVQPIAIDSQFAFNPGTNYQMFIAATVIPALLHILATVAGAYGFGRELRDKTLRTRLNGISRGYRGTRFTAILCALHGKLFWPLISYTVWGAFSLSLIAQHHPIPAFEWWICFFAYYVLISVSLWLGVLLSAVPVSLRMGLSGAALITAPAYAFSGMTYPLFMMSDGARRLAGMLPLTRYLHIQVMTLEQDATLTQILPSLCGFAVAGIGLMLLSVCACLYAFGQPQRWGGR